MSLFSGMEHIGLPAVDTTALAEWYCDVFNMMKIYISDTSPPIYFLTDEYKSFKVEIFPVKENKKDMIHLCFSVENIELALKYLNSKGIDFGTIKTLMKGGQTVFLLDPEGNRIQVVYRPEKLWRCI